MAQRIPHRPRAPSPRRSGLGTEGPSSYLAGDDRRRDTMSNAQKVVIITGASSGIGRACAIKLSELGWAVVLSARRALELRATAEQCEGETLEIVGDVSREEDVVSLFDATLTRFGRLDLLFNNAGLSGTAEAIDSITLVNFEAVMAVNITAAVLCSREAFRIFKKQDPFGGRVINNGSLSAFAPRPEAAAYSISKHAMTGLTKSIALDGRPYNITATQLDIGNAATDMTRHSEKGTLQADGAIRSEPLMDIAHIANAVAYIAELPNEVTLLEMIIMATGMPFVGRG